MNDMRPLQHIWLRLLGGGSRGGEKQRLVKELLESLHVIARVMDHVETDLSDNHPEPISILDLCSGFGYLSMFLAHLLPAHRVDRIILLDKAWPMHSQDQPSAGDVPVKVEYICVWRVADTPRFGLAHAFPGSALRR